ncbi:hypothetical protein VTO73DRAFT_347 [Trametes versicolor]
MDAVLLGVPDLAILETTAVFTEGHGTLRDINLWSAAKKLGVQLGYAMCIGLTVPLWLAPNAIFQKALTGWPMEVLVSFLNTYKEADSQKATMVPGHEEIRATQTGHAAYDVTLHPRELTSKDMRECTSAKVPTSLFPPSSSLAPASSLPSYSPMVVYPAVSADFSATVALSAGLLGCRLTAQDEGTSFEE